MQHWFAERSIRKRSNCPEENAMHGQIGGLNFRMQTRGDLDFYYRTRAALSDARRQLGGNNTDYDFYRARARKERDRVRRETLKPLTRFIRPLVAVAAIAAALWMMPAIPQDCANCGTHDVHTITGLQ
jgi:hypothetical protein